MGVFCYLVYNDKNSIVKLVLFLILMLMKSNLFHQVIIINSLFTVMTAALECSQFPLVEMESTTSLPILFIYRYDSSTGVFTVPPGGDGVYYFSMYVLVQDGELGHFDMRLNGDGIFSSYSDHNNNGANDYAPGSCSAVVNVAAGNVYIFHGALW